MQTQPLWPLAVLLVLLAICAAARYFSKSAGMRNAFSVALVVLALITAFFVFFNAGAWIRTQRAAAHAQSGGEPRLVAAASARAMNVPALGHTRARAEQ